MPRSSETGPQIEREAPMKALRGEQRSRMYPLLAKLGGDREKYANYAWDTCVNITMNIRRVEEIAVAVQSSTRYARNVALFGRLAPFGRSPTAPLGARNAE
ncbi:hypothetical protein PRIPAC_79882 [Pristionchus pacificus]|uniref:Uncharacterized protein n=1 Tax=Pristionchus pacificus TaxID=54126 RepID=A0A2A6CQ71_PRIPA|nr:hypothetical protein PRIPAC_79882 [Pristionchus pacificus]|eukprot:PDM80270.1 hypothetical protein PRIPAC_32849 [Pristionchus pacificus]